MEESKESKESDGRGGSRPGAGRKPKALKKLQEDLLGQGSDAVAAYRFVVDTLRDANQDIKIRLDCAKEIMDRTWGKPKQAIEMGGVSGGPIQIQYVNDWRGEFPRGDDLFTLSASGASNGSD